LTSYKEETLLTPVHEPLQVFSRWPSSTLWTLFRKICTHTHYWAKYGFIHLSWNEKSAKAMTCWLVKNIWSNISAKSQLRDYLWRGTYDD
jgi:hypothetical protein